MGNIVFQHPARSGECWYALSADLSAPAACEAGLPAGVPAIADSSPVNTLLLSGAIDEIILPGCRKAYWEERKMKQVSDKKQKLKRKDYEKKLHASFAIYKTG